MDFNGQDPALLATLQPMLCAASPRAALAGLTSRQAYRGRGRSLIDAVLEAEEDRVDIDQLFKSFCEGATLATREQIEGFQIFRDTVENFLQKHRIEQRRERALVHLFRNMSSPRQYAIGEKVMLRGKALPKEPPATEKRKWFGPYTVVAGPAAATSRTCFVSIKGVPHRVHTIQTKEWHPLAEYSPNL